MKRIYLAGAINGCADDECKDWRAKAKELLGDGYECIDPMIRDYRGKELTNAAQIVHMDKYDIDRADILLVRCEAPSWGTAMEIMYAYEREKLIVAWTGLANVSPWVRFHAHCLVPHLVEAIAFIINTYGEMEGIPSTSPHRFAEWCECDSCSDERLRRLAAERRPDQK